MARLVERGQGARDRRLQLRRRAAERCEAVRHVDSLQPPFSLIRREVAADLVPYAREHGIGVITYSPIPCSRAYGTRSILARASQREQAAAGESTHAPPGREERHSREVADAALAADARRENGSGPVRARARDRRVRDHADPVLARVRDQIRSRAARQQRERRENGSGPVRARARDRRDHVLAARAARPAERELRPRARGLAVADRLAIGVAAVPRSRALGEPRSRRAAAGDRGARGDGGGAARRRRGCSPCPA